MVKDSNKERPPVITRAQMEAQIEAAYQRAIAPALRERMKQLKALDVLFPQPSAASVARPRRVRSEKMGDATKPIGPPSPDMPFTESRDLNPPDMTPPSFPEPDPLPQPSDAPVSTPTPNPDMPSFDDVIDTDADEALNAKEES